MRFSYAEVLLTYAVAKIEGNQIDQSVLDAINLIRKRADVAMPVYVGITSQAELRKIVRDERVRDLAFGGLHYSDIRRWRTEVDRKFRTRNSIWLSNKRQFFG